MNEPETEYTFDPYAAYEPREAESHAEARKQRDADKSEVKAPLRSASSFVTSYLNKLDTNSLPKLYPQKEALSGFEWGPGMVTLIGGPPGTGKTGLATQLMLDALELNPSLRAVVANAEMSYETIVQRRLCKMTRLDSYLIRFGYDRSGEEITAADRERIHEAATDLSFQLDRVMVLEECNLTNVTLLKNEQPAMLLVDYLQLFTNGDKDARQGVNEAVKELLALKLLGWGILALSSVKRNSKGVYDSKDLNLSSFKESGDIEFTADSAYTMANLKDAAVDGKPWLQDVRLLHCKNRHGFTKSYDLRFNKARQEFDAIPKDSASNQFAGDFSDNPYSET